MSKRQRLQLRKATPADCRDIWVWRNDPVTRAQSLTSRRISYSDHKKWFSKVLKDRRRALYVASQNRFKIGVLRVDRIEKGIVEVSLNVRTEERGRGFGKKILKLADRLIKNTRGVLQKALIKNKNTASEKTFSVAGYRKIHEIHEKDYSIWIKL